MKKYIESEIVFSANVNEHIYKMVFNCPEIAAHAEMGQFINVYLDKGEMILPRPISIQDVDREKGTLSIMYQIAGKGTEYMTGIGAGKKLNIAGPLGKGFSYENNNKLALIGGGIGVPPMYYSAKAIRKKHPDAKIKAFIGFRSKEFVILEDEFRALGVETVVTTDDGSYGCSGNALQAFKESGFPAEAIFACGPSVMLKFVAAFAEEKGIECQVSMEERMGCGIGACVGCAIAIKKDCENGFEYKKVCKDGPVFDAREVLWQ